MSDIVWNKEAQEKFKLALSKMPFFQQRIAEKAVSTRVVLMLEEENRQEVTEKDMVLAFFKEVPGPFQGMMKDVLKQAEIDYEKYV